MRTQQALRRVTVAIVAVPLIAGTFLAQPTGLAAAAPIPVAHDDTFVVDARYPAGQEFDIPISALLANDENVDSATNPVQFAVWSEPRVGELITPCPTCDPYADAVSYVQSDPDVRTDTFNYVIVDGDGDFSIGTVVIVMNHYPNAVIDFEDPNGDWPFQTRTDQYAIAADVLANDVGLTDRPLSVTAESGEALQVIVSCAPTFLFGLQPVGLVSGALGTSYTITDADGDESTTTAYLYYADNARQDPPYGPPPCTNDFDGDLVSDQQELVRPTDPNAKDSDRDTIEDGSEVGTDPQDPDSDHDCVGDALDSDPTGGPAKRSCEPCLLDTDRDDLSDCVEDADRDGVWDIGLETNLDDADTDRDFLNDGYETNTSVTSPLHADTDGDGRSDGEELQVAPASNPLLEDTDGDGWFDGEEVFAGTSPTNRRRHPSGQVRVPTRATATIDTPVLFIHGIQNVADVDFEANRAGEDVNCSDYWGAFKQRFVDFGFVQSGFKTIGYYGKDSGCDVDISDYGRYANGDDLNHTLLSDANDHYGEGLLHGGDTNIEHLAAHWAWYIHNEYSAHGQPVAIVAHSMGGLITRYALNAVERGDRDFPGPGSLLVSSVVTLATPHLGGNWLTPACVEISSTPGISSDGSWDQCEEMVPGSPFLNELAMEARHPNAGGTDWTNVGAYFDEAVPPDSSMGMAGDHQYFYLERLSPRECFAKFEYQEIWAPYQDENHFRDSEALCNHDHGGIHTVSVDNFRGLYSQRFVAFPDRFRGADFLANPATLAAAATWSTRW